ncbi:MAG: radical SAM protein [Candidatus Marinimicrobia bacterium]|nr:radical SAM protein [Candidatus Neomarinimicrobiota bacterium]
MTYHYLFGPVPSRRLGISLGIDMVPHKICTLNCVYCECGPTTRLTTERREYIPFETVSRELDAYLKNNPVPDYITFSGSGEPTLNSRTGDIIKLIKKRYSGIPVAVLTNGTLFSDPDVRRELLKADLVLPSLDAVNSGIFLRLNRPAPGLEVNSHIQGLMDFRREYGGKIWLEVFILQGYNDDKEHLEALRKTLMHIAADKIQINTLDRPGAVKGLRAARAETLEKIRKDWDLPQLELVAAVSHRKKEASFRKDIENAILETVSRRPCTLKDLSRILGLHPNEVNKYLDVLEADERIETKEMDRGSFYQRKQRKRNAKGA